MQPEDFEERLREIFPWHSVHLIRRIVHDVLSDDGSLDPDDFNLERMTDILLCELPEDQKGEVVEEFIQSEDEAFGYHEGDNASLRDRLLRAFPDMCPAYLDGRLDTEDMDFSNWMWVLSNEPYLKTVVNMDTNHIHKRLTDMLPKVDPDFLKTEANKLAGKSEEQIQVFINSIIDQDDKPSIDNYYKRVSYQKLVEQYTTEFKFDEFLNEIPDPVSYFSNDNRQHSLLPKTDGTDISKDVEFARCALYNIYTNLRKSDIERYMSYFKNDLIKIAEKLDRFQKAFKKPREEIPLPTEITPSREMLQELAYVKYGRRIKQYLKLKNEAYKKMYEEAKKANLLEECQICTMDNLIPEECYFCQGSCVFCKGCMKDGFQVKIGDGKYDFTCLNRCGSEFSLITLQMVLDPVTFTRLDKRKQMSDLITANIDGFMTCMSCDFGKMQSPSSKIFVCENPDCGKELCLECMHDSHIPKRCNEMEYEEDVKMRTFIENRMTEALLRICKKCQKSIIKENGCNKMTCVCGTTMCYICGLSGIEYNHFGAGMPCGLHTNQTALHQTNVLTAAETAKKELGLDQDPTKLKFDPSIGVTTYIPH